MPLLSWIALYPQWYADERAALAKRYPEFQVDAARLRDGTLALYGELVVRPRGGAQRFPVALFYPEATPYEKPIVLPLENLPSYNEGAVDQATIHAKLFDHRHQMPGGGLCLFQRETRADPEGDIVSGVDVLRRAERWFLGMITGHWPPDSTESELEAHFRRANDILISETFFAPSLAGARGRFFYVRDYRRLIDAQTRDLGECPMIMTALTIDSGLLTQALDARADLSRVYPWISAETWNTTEIVRARAPGGGPLDAPEHGYWWSLPGEPRPFGDGAGLLRELAAAMPGADPWETLRDALAATYSVTEWPVIGFRYPGRSSDPEWLVATVRFSAPREAGGVVIESDAAKRARFASAPVLGIRAHSIRPAELRLRNTGVVADGVAAKTVALVGLGALGSAIAEMLAKAGVGKFRLCDGDRLATGNVARHVGGVHEFGAAKVRVVASRLVEINPFLTFEDDDLRFDSATDSLEALRSFIAPADLVIATTADEGVESLINHLAVLAGKPVIYARALRRGSVGRVFLVRPGQDACKACLAALARACDNAGDATTGWIGVPEGADDILLHECGRPVIPASAVDLTFVAALAARVGLSALEDGATDANHWLWSQSALPEIDARLSLPMSTIAATFTPRAGCPVCRAPEVTALVLADEARREIQDQAAAALTVETGGILIGYVDDQRRAVVLRATGPGPSAQQTASIFRRDVAFVQSALERAARELGERGLYVGEWHSHLESDPQPSPTDISSLVGIAESPNYLNRSPVMVIAGLDSTSGRCAGLKAWAFRAGGGVWPIEIHIEIHDVETRT